MSTVIVVVAYLEKSSADCNAIMGIQSGQGIVPTSGARLKEILSSAVGGMAGVTSGTIAVTTGGGDGVAASSGALNDLSDTPYGVLATFTDSKTTTDIEQIFGITNGGGITQPTDLTNLISTLLNYIEGAGVANPAGVRMSESITGIHDADNFTADIGKAAV